jgi:hypothetical protein
MEEASNRRTMGQTGLSNRRDSISKITREKELEAWLKW